MSPRWFLLSPPAAAGPASHLRHSAFVYAATPIARGQGMFFPLTVLISVAFARQRNGSGDSRLGMEMCRKDTFFSTIMGISNCRHGYF